VETVADGYNEPLYVTAAPGDDSRLFVVEQDGSIHIIADGTAIDTPFLDIESQVSRTDNERGMFGIAFHPDYQNNGRFFVHYSASEDTHGLNNGDTVVSEFTVSDDPNVADSGSERLIVTETQPDWNHNGGMLVFGPDGYLYIGLGDGGGGGDAYGNGQNLESILGTIIRIDVDDTSAGEYGIPSGNMTGDAVAPEIWDYGLRNPWRFSFDACTGDLYIADVGQNELEEVNVEPAGTGKLNYGWNVTEGLACYAANSCEMEGLIEPVLDYGHGDGTSVTGGYVYRGSAIPGLRGTYLYADFSSERVWTFRWDGAQAADQGEVTDDLELGGGGGITSFGQDNTGELYIVRRGGAIQKIVPE
jgi:glucose/arabinose dehydrogenase